MQEVANPEKFHILIELLKDVKLSLVDATINIDDSVTETLGLDSLDILQLARKIRRRLGGEFDVDAWVENNATHGGSVKSILEAITESPV